MYQEHFEEKKDHLIMSLKGLMKLIFRRDTLMVSYTSDQEGFAQIPALTEEFKSTLPAEEMPKAETIRPLGLKNEGFTTASKVQYVCRAGNFKKQAMPTTAR